MKKAFLIFLLASSATAIFAQRSQTRPYHYGFGAGYQPKVNEAFFAAGKLYGKKGGALQLFGYNYTQAWRLTAICLPNLPITNDGHLRALVGLGGHLGVWKEGKATNSWRTNPIVGIDGLLGAEYSIPKAHLSFQVHYQPNADIGGNNQIFTDWGGFVVYFTL